MAIDDPQDAIEAIHASEERLHSPLVRFLPYLQRLFSISAGFIPSPGNLALGALDIAAAFIKQKEEDSRSELLDILSQEIRYLKSHIDETKRTDEYADFMRAEFPGLVLDGLQKAEQTRARDRIRRLGKILGYAADQGPLRKSDDTEEMLRVAMGLDEGDVKVLKIIYGQQHKYLRSDGAIERTLILQISSIYPLRNAGFNDSEIVSRCAKLQSYGLIQEVENRSLNNLANEPAPQGLLQKGRDFIIYILGATQSE